MKKPSVTKNLILSSALLLLAILTCVGVSFAYFSSGNAGGGNSAEIGNFYLETAFENVGSSSVTSEFIVKNTTVINPEAVTAPTDTTAADYDNLYSIYRYNGDDTKDNFNDLAIAYKLNITNKSNTDIYLSYNVSALANGEPFDAIKFFAFDNSDAVLLTTPNTSTYGNYFDAIHNAYTVAAAAQTPPARPLNLTALNYYESYSKLQFDFVDDYYNSLRSTAALNAVTSANSSAVYSSTTSLIVVWVDWRLYNAYLEQILSSGGNVTAEISVQLTVSVTATNERGAQRN